MPQKNPKKTKDIGPSPLDAHNETIEKITNTFIEIWDRIGFNEETKTKRLQKFFDQVGVSLKFSILFFFLKL